MASEVPAEGSVSTAGPGYATGLVSVAVGGDSCGVAVADGEAGAVRVAKRVTSDGIAVSSTVGGTGDSLRSFVRKIHPKSPRIKTTPSTRMIRSSKSKEGRGCIPGKVLLRLYPHSFHYGFQRSDSFEMTLQENRAF